MKNPETRRKILIFIMTLPCTFSKNEKCGNKLVIRFFFFKIITAHKVPYGSKKVARKKKLH
jgi:hypothetical protein